MGNQLKTTLLLGALTGIILAFGSLLGGGDGLVLAFFLAAAMNLGSYWFSDKIVLRLYGAKPIDPQGFPKLYQIVRNLCLKAQVPMPALYLIPSPSPNAFATGRNPEHAAVAVTEGILNILTPEELEGVLAHELSHVKNRDILISSIAATLAGAIMMVANMARWATFFGGFSRGGREDESEGGGGFLGLILMAVVAPIAAAIIQMAISRSREYLADATGARISGNPLGLARALEKLFVGSERIPLEARPETSHLFIMSPLSGGRLLNLFSTHPPIEDRIRRLRAMVGVR
jgi:heat shock protein HtpX